MLYNIIAFIATVVILTLLGAAGGGMPKAWIGLGVMAICFGAANAIRSAIRHNPKGAQPSSPLIPTTPTPRASATAATKSPAEGSPLVGVEVGSRPAGQEIDGRLMITDVEMKAIVHQYSAFSNTFHFQTDDPSAGFAVFYTPTDWFLVLSPQSAVFFNREGTQIWNVTPEGLRLNRNPLAPRAPVTVEVRSVDGRRETVLCGGTPSAFVSVVAWMSDTDEKFRANAADHSAIWGLLARELETGFSPAPFLRWTLPWHNMHEGIAQLSNNAQILEEFVRGLAPFKDAVGARLRTAGIQDNHPIHTALAQAAASEEKTGLYALGAFVLLVGNCLVFILLGSDVIGGVTASVFAVGCTALALYLFIVGHRASNSGTKVAG